MAIRGMDVNLGGMAISTVIGMGPSGGLTMVSGMTSAVFGGTGVV